MPGEPAKIMIRRFTDRILESGLLVLAVALGVGVSAAGMALLADTRAYGARLLSSPEYHEIVVGTHGEISDMERPVVEKPVLENTVLTRSDLSVADMIPTISHAYISNRKMLHFINASSIARDEEMRKNMGAPPAGPPGGDGPPEGAGNRPEGAPEPPKMYTAEELARAQTASDIVIVEQEEATGYSVTDDFFTSQEMVTVSGSLFTIQDYSSQSSSIILGSSMAELLTPDGEDAGYLLGKKILTRDGYSTVVGILAPTGRNYDDYFFSPYSDGNRFGFMDFRMRGMNTQLRFAVTDPADLDRTAELLSDWFTDQFGDGQVMVSNPRAEARKLLARNTGISFLILFLSYAGLFIAAVNVSNILMSRSMRMKKHIGILMALGASRRMIIRLFSGEALAVTGLGSVIGAVLAFPLSRSMQEALGMGSGSILFTLIGIVISFLLTLGFGLIPVRSYSKIDPAVAMTSV